MVTPKQSIAEITERKNPVIGGPSKTRTLDPLIKSTNQQVQPNYTDELNTQQLELWPDPQ